MALRSQWWLSPSSAAFLASVLEIATFLPYLLVRVEHVDGIGSSAPAVVSAGILLLVVCIGLQAYAMWGISRQQEWIAPMTLRFSRLSIVTYAVLSAVVVLLHVFTAFGPPPAQIPVWIYHVPIFVQSVCFGALALTSAHGMRSVLQRWACGGLPIAFVFGCPSALSRMLGSSITDLWPWLPVVHVGVRAAMWAAVGGWLRTASLDQLTVAQ